jgi:hypothetical protein
MASQKIAEVAWKISIGYHIPYLGFGCNLHAFPRRGLCG